MQYIKECLQLLYWIYFKPYTLKRHVQAICPEITDPYKDNFYRRSVAAKANPRLKRYDDQCWWLTVVVPIVLIFLCAPLVAGPGVLQFNWLKSNLFLTGWIQGQVFFRVIRRKLKAKSSLLVSIVAMVPLFICAFLLKQVVAVVAAIGFMVLGLAGGMVFGIAGLVVFGVARSVTFSVAGGITVCVLVGVAVNMDAGVVAVAAGSIAFGGVFGVLISMAGDVAVSMAAGVASGVAVSMAAGSVVTGVVGMAVGVSFILGVLRFYFWLPELLWMLFLKLVPIPAARCLPWLPPRFDQLIYIPLPFMPGLIAEAYQENQVAALRSLSYLITSTNQQNVALRAIFLIVVEECRRCRTARDIVAIREQFAGFSEKASFGLVACLDISQDVNAALEASTIYRQAQQLDKVIQKIDSKRNSLASASAREATTFGSVLDQWQGILETARKTLREQAARSNEIPQVYLAGPALDPNKAGPLFKGRRDLFRQIETLTLSAQHPTLVMHGGRRSGKTSTLNYLPKWLPSDILPLLIDGQSLAATSTLSGFAEEFAEQLIRSARKVHSLQLPAVDSVTPSDDPFVTLRRWLDAVEQAVPDKTLLLCLDEFERLDEIVRSTDSRAPLNFLRHLIQHRDRWTLLFTGVLTPEELPAYWSDYLINCETLRVSYLAEADCLELIQHPVEDFPAIYPAPVAHAIRDLTGGQPYFTQLLCHELVEQLNRKKAKIVQLDDLQTVLPAVFERGYQVFREFRQSLTEPQRALLLAVAEEKTPSEEAMRAAPVLVRKEILAQENGGWCFRVPLIRRWLVEGQHDLS